jgi:hypothetical protein
MSIVTLKRKTATKYNNMSVNSMDGFSLNGTHRSQGWVGQNVISRSLPRTTMKSHGGCNGTFSFQPVILSGVNSTEDINVVKTSSLGTRGLIDTKYRWIRRPFPFASVKPDATLNINDQSSYVTSLAKETIKMSDDCQEINTTHFKGCGGACYPQIFRSLSSPGNLPKSLQHTKPPFTALSQSEYLSKKQNPCQANDVFTIPSDGPLGMKNNFGYASGCSNSSYSIDRSNNVPHSASHLTMGPGGI